MDTGPQSPITITCPGSSTVLVEPSLLLDSGIYRNARLDGSTQRWFCTICSLPFSSTRAPPVLLSTSTVAPGVPAATRFTNKSRLPTTPFRSATKLRNAVGGVNRTISPGLLLLPPTSRCSRGVTFSTSRTSPTCNVGSMDRLGMTKKERNVERRKAVVKPVTAVAKDPKADTRLYVPGDTSFGMLASVTVTGHGRSSCGTKG